MKALKQIKALGRLKLEVNTYGGIIIRLVLKCSRTRLASPPPKFTLVNEGECNAVIEYFKASVL